ncbi:VOC family protein [Streptomyces durmitorensis]|uniref:VOC family protein n=1 Tax=Streptomyces durmitorensis TaxID=319947 RepID=A0ABY4PWI0_9ACTN|nr:VOC family protein [Streptomyces durmitorensis]UQT58156.1 VOC family protein [Streptomyces durmitorensis]
MTPVARMRNVVLDCPDPRQLAEFYAHLLGGTVEGDEGEDWVTLHAPGGLRLCFQEAPGHRPPNWPQAGAGSQQIHLDLDVGPAVQDIERAQERALALGAKPLDVDDDNGSRDFRVYADPAGHPFCLCRIDEG